MLSHNKRTVHSCIIYIIHEILAAMADAPGPTELSRPEWFAAFLADRGTRKPSAHTLKAYRQDFDAIATLIAGDADAVAGMLLGDITTDSMRTAFAQYAKTHEAASVGDAAAGSNATAPSSSPRCWPACAPRNCCAPTPATFDPATTALSSMSAARTAGYRSNWRWWRSSSTIWTAGRPVSPPQPDSAPPTSSREMRCSTVEYSAR
jgi:hypothetical protein